jgi:hypothetical protein
MAVQQLGKMVCTAVAPEIPVLQVVVVLKMPAELLVETGVALKMAL